MDHRLERGQGGEACREAAREAVREAVRKAVGRWKSNR
jgi:hypothetical protein